MKTPKRSRQTDVYLLLRGLISGAVRWQSFAIGPSGEVCFDGLRHFCHVDDRGIPILTPAIREKLIKEAVKP